MLLYTCVCLSVYILWTFLFFRVRADRGVEIFDVAQLMLAWAWHWELLSGRKRAQSTVQHDYFLFVYFVFTMKWLYSHFLNAVMKCLNLKPHNFRLTTLSLKGCGGVWMSVTSISCSVLHSLGDEGHLDPSNCILLPLCVPATSATQPQRALWRLGQPAVQDWAGHDSKPDYD